MFYLFSLSTICTYIFQLLSVHFIAWKDTVTTDEKHHKIYEDNNAWWANSSERVNAIVHHLVPILTS